MPRRSAQGPGSPDGAPVGIMDTGSGTAGESLDLRPSASVSPENVNVFVEGVSDGAPGLRLASLGGRTLGGAIALSVQAWVRNLAYDKEVWVDVRLLGGDEVLHAETLPLQYQDPARVEATSSPSGPPSRPPGRASRSPPPARSSIASTAR